MPKKIDPSSRSVRCGWCWSTCRSTRRDRGWWRSSAAQLGVGKETVRRLGRQARDRWRSAPALTSEELAEIKELKARVRRLEEDNEILRKARDFLRGGTRPPQPLIMAFIDDDASRGPRGRVDLPGPARAGLPGRRADLPGLEAAGPHGRGADGHRRGR